MQDILSGNSKPAPIYKYWQSKYDMEAVDSLEDLVGSTTDIVMLAQPRAMAPADLADFDDWIRKGGNAIIMTDPDLVWHSELPLGDPQRPLSGGLLSPLLKHWGLELVSQGDDIELIEMEYAEGTITTIGVGAFEVLNDDSDQKQDCTFSAAGFIAQCQIGQGHVILIADADFLHEQLWDESSEWRDGGKSGAMRFTDTLVAQFSNISKD